MKNRKVEKHYNEKAETDPKQCTQECESMKLGEHIVHHIHDALEKNGPKLTREQCQSQVLGMCGGGVIMPKQMNVMMKAINEWYDKWEKKEEPTND